MGHGLWPEFSKDDTERVRRSVQPEIWRNLQQGQWLHEYQYLRGLDGQTAAATKRAKKADESATSPEKETNALDLIKTQISGKENATVSESPEGPVQFDYLRRIADEITAKGKELRAQGSAIKAIGVVGTDVFDKLLVLQALRPYFPDALFFTTDLDAALTLPSERDFTRNLIVVSSFRPGTQ